jgi:hypothetical protein
MIFSLFRNHGIETNPKPKRADPAAYGSPPNNPTRNITNSRAWKR